MQPWLWLAAQGAGGAARRWASASICCSRGRSISHSTTSAVQTASSAISSRRRRGVGR